MQLRTNAQIPITRVRPAMGTWLLVTVSDCDPGLRDVQNLITAAFDRVYELEKIFSFFDSNSELSRLNGDDSIGHPRSVSTPLLEVLQWGSKIELDSHRAFRLMPRCAHPDCYAMIDDQVIRKTKCVFDLGGIAKGYIVDCVFEQLSREIQSGKLMVNAGGDLRMRGDHRLNIENFGDAPQLLHGLVIDRGAIATSHVPSGSTERQLTTAQYPDPFGIRNTTVTVTAPQCWLADALTKVALQPGVRPGQLRRLGATRAWSFGSGDWSVHENF